MSNVRNSGLTGRIKFVRSVLEEKNLDGLLVTNVSNVSYLSLFTGDSSILLVTMEHVVLITDPRYVEQAQQECPGIEVMLWFKNIRYGFETYQLLINKYSIKKLGVEASHISLSTYQYLFDNLKNVQLIATGGLVEQNRIIKDKAEVGHLRRACEISDQALTLTLREIKPGISEMEVAATLEYNLRMSGADNISFETLLLTGKRTSLLHGKPSTTNIAVGDYLLFDFGALVNGYHADVSRTIMIGEPSAKQKELYIIIKECQQAIIGEIRSGTHVDRVNALVERMIPGNYKPYFYNGYGHGVGLDIHEEPFLKAEADFVFKEGMVLTVEPGIYIPGWGGLRIEDTVLVGKENAEPLSTFSRDLLVVG